MTVLEIKQKLQAHAAIDPLPDQPQFVRGCSRPILEWFNEFNDILLENITTFDLDRPVALLTVCSYAKPYSHSFIHYGIRKALWEPDLLDKIEYWHLSSAGVIPSCMEEEVPFCCYDWNNKDASEDDLKDLRLRLESYFRDWLVEYAEKLDKTVVTYFRRDSNTQQAIDAVGYHPYLPVRHVRVKSWQVSTHQWDLVTLNQRYLDPDAMLLDQANLQSLVRVLSDRLGDSCG